MRKIKRDIIRILRILYMKNYITSRTGNISARTLHNTMIITPSASEIPKPLVKSEDLVEIDIESGKIIQGRHKPSIETTMHLMIYRSRSDVHAIIHTHNPLPVIAEELGLLKELEHSEEVILLGRGIGTVPKLKPGSTELATYVAKLSRDNDVIVLRGHGIVSLGTNLYEALDRIEVLEHIALKIIVKYLMSPRWSEYL